MLSNELLNFRDDMLCYQLRSDDDNEDTKLGRERSRPKPKTLSCCSQQTQQDRHYSLCFFLLSFLHNFTNCKRSTKERKQNRYTQSGNLSQDDQARESHIHTRLYKHDNKAGHVLDVLYHGLSVRLVFLSALDVRHAFLVIRAFHMKFSPGFLLFTLGTTFSFWDTFVNGPSSGLPEPVSI